MDSIKHAVELARSAEHGARVVDGHSVVPHGNAPNALREIRLNPAHLEKNRIVAHGGISGQPGRYYDMLRTQVLQEMDKKGWQFLAVTSPTPGCGKTVTACNLALSIARLPERSVFLVDLDLRKPTLATYLGFKPEHGVTDVLEGPGALSSAVVETAIGPTKMLVLPGSTTSHNSSEWMASQTMATLLERIKRDFRSRTVIFDLPPMLLGDDVISILPRMDAVLLIAAVGSTSVTDIKECQKHLQRTPVVRVVVNKTAVAAEGYYGYGYY